MFVRVTLLILPRSIAVSQLNFDRQTVRCMIYLVAQGDRRIRLQDERYPTTHSGADVISATIHALYGLFKNGLTTGNMRVIFDIPQ